MASSILPAPATAGVAGPASAPIPPSSSNTKPRPKAFHDITSTYAARFGKNDDQATVTDEQRQIRQQTAAEGTDQYYDFATSAYLNGWSTHFHYTPFSPHDTLASAMSFYEHRLAHLMALTPSMKVLDVGCGVGGPAREIAKFVGCQVVGITINQRQVDTAIEMTARAGLGHLCTFVRGDFLRLEEIFGPGTFDAAYAIEATVHAPDLAAVYAGIAKVLKPHAVFGLSEWVLTERYDARNTRHVGIRNRIERGNAISNLQTSAQCREAMVLAGFELFHDENYAKHWDYLVREGQPRAPPFSRVTVPMKGEGETDQSLAPPPSCRINAQPLPLRPWYWPLAGQYKLATTWEDWWIAFRMSRHPRLVGYWAIWILEKLRLYPKGVIEAMSTMAYCVDSVVEGGQEDCFTPCWWFIGRKTGEDKREWKEYGNFGEWKDGRKRRKLTEECFLDNYRLRPN